MITLQMKIFVFLLFRLILCSSTSIFNRTIGDDSENNLLLKRFSGTQFLSSGVVKDADGNEYPLSHLEAYTGLFSEKHFLSTKDGVEVCVKDVRSGETMPVAVFRATYEGGIIVQVEKNSAGEIVFVEIRRPRGQSDTFLIRNKNLKSTGEAGDNTGNGTVNGSNVSELEDEFLEYTADDLDDEFISNNYHYGVVDDEPEPEGVSDRGFDFFRLTAPQTLPDFHYVRGDSTSSECTFFKVVNIAVVYDSEFCKMYGSFDATRRRIMTIVSSASIVYERDMCVKLALTDIYTPDTRASCQRDSSDSFVATEGQSGTTINRSFFDTFPRNDACGQQRNDTFLATFSDWMKNTRDSLGIDRNSAIHMFTGYTPKGTIGCAWKGTLCNKELSYGVEYLSFTTDIHTQSNVLAHELGHNLNSSHLTRSADYQHVMEPSLSTAVDGFSQHSIDEILSFLDAPTIECDGIVLQPTTMPSGTHSELFRPRNPSPPSMFLSHTPSPTPPPTMPPTPPPTSPPTSPPTEGKVEDCFIEQGNSFLDPVCVNGVSSDRGNNQYACFDALRLMPAQLSSASSSFSSMSTCQLIENDLPITTTIIECDGEFNNGMIVEAEEKKSKKKKKSDYVRKGIRKTNSDQNDNTNNDIEESTLGPREIETNDRCTETCIIVSNYVCFLATTSEEDNDERVYNLTYQAFATGPGAGIINSEIFTTSVQILNSGSNDLDAPDSCQDALTWCES